LNFYYGSS